MWIELHRLGWETTTSRQDRQTAEKFIGGMDSGVEGGPGDGHGEFERVKDDEIEDVVGEHLCHSRRRTEHWSFQVPGLHRYHRSVELKGNELIPLH